MFTFTRNNQYYRALSVNIYFLCMSLRADSLYVNPIGSIIEQIEDNSNLLSIPCI